MINKLIKVGNITELEKRIAGRLGRGQLLFGNRLQLAEIKILSLIREIKENEDYFKECNFCQKTRVGLGFFSNSRIFKSSTKTAE